jgi:hypothetical protein
MIVNTAFISYTRADDRQDPGAFADLCEDLSAAVQEQSDTPFKIFRDVDDIKPGENWEWRLERAVSETDAFIPVVTPNFLASKWCRREVSLFDDKEGRQGLNLIFPIHYVDTTHIADPADEIVRSLRRHQWSDWREVRSATRGSAVRRRAVVAIAEGIAKTIATARKQLEPDSQRAAQRLFGIALQLIETEPEDALHVLNQLLEHYPDAPLVYRMQGFILRAQALEALGQPALGVAQLDLLIDQLTYRFPPGEPKHDPTMRQIIEANLTMARDLRANLAGGSAAD